jgi:hypothetical protein
MLLGYSRTHGAAQLRRLAEVSSFFRAVNNPARRERVIGQPEKSGDLPVGDLLVQAVAFLIAGIANNLDGVSRRGGVILIKLRVARGRCLLRSQLLSDGFSQLYIVGDNDQPSFAAGTHLRDLRRDENDTRHSGRHQQREDDERAGADTL